MTIEQAIKHLSKKDQKYILADEDMIKDILEQNLDEEEIDSLLIVSRHLDAQKKKKQLSE